MFKRHTKCRVCGTEDLVSVADFGLTPLANDFRKPGEEVAGYAPLKVLYCADCSLAQLSATVNPMVLYSNYSYVSSTSETMKNHMRALIGDICAFRGGRMGSVLEIGSNTGVFLEMCKPVSIIQQGVDPAKNLSEEANKNGIQTVCGLFEPNITGNLLTADVIVARHVFAHVDNWKEFVGTLDLVSHEDTLVVIEVPYIGDMLDKTEWDSVYHEHLSYVSMKSVNSLLNGTRWVCSGYKRYSVHGGAIAFFIQRRGREKSYMMDDEFSADDFRKSSDAWKRNARSFADSVFGIGNRKVFGYGATAKTTLWTSFLGLRRSDIEFVHDNTPQKQGCFMPGTDIPVTGGTEGMESCDVGVVFAWNYFDEIKRKSPPSVAGKLVVPFRVA